MKKFMTTLFVDSSWCPELMVGGYGAWVKSHDMIQGEFFGNHFKDPLMSSIEAEMFGIGQSIKHCLKMGMIDMTRPNQTIMIQNDCTNAMGTLLFRVPHTFQSKKQTGAKGDVDINLCRVKPSIVDQEVIDMMTEMTKSNVRFILRHVKGHRASSDSTRYSLNNRCDQIARFHMKERQQMALYNMRVKKLEQESV